MGTVSKEVFGGKGSGQGTNIVSLYFPNSGLVGVELNRRPEEAFVIVGFPKVNVDAGAGKNDN